jgi:hypothetical protein
MPVIANEPTYLFRTPNGIQSISNPLYRYVFHPVPGTASSPDKAFKVGKFTGLPYTVRSINDDGGIDINKGNELLRTDGKYVTRHPLSTLDCADCFGRFMQLTHDLLMKLNGSFAHFLTKTQLRPPSQKQGST